MNTIAITIAIICLAGWWAAMMYDVVTLDTQTAELTDPLFMKVYGVAFVFACYGLYGLI